jgi:hypothetical protein
MRVKIKRQLWRYLRFRILIAHTIFWLIKPAFDEYEKKEADKYVALKDHLFPEGNLSAANKIINPATH